MFSWQITTDLLLEELFKRYEVAFAVYRDIDGIIQYKSKGSNLRVIGLGTQAINVILKDYKNNSNKSTVNTCDTSQVKSNQIQISDLEFATTKEIISGIRLRETPSVVGVLNPGKVDQNQEYRIFTEGNYLSNLGLINVLFYFLIDQINYENVESSILNDEFNLSTLDDSKVCVLAKSSDPIRFAWKGLSLDVLGLIENLKFFIANFNGEETDRD